LVPSNLDRTALRLPALNSVFLHHELLLADRFTQHVVRVILSGVTWLGTCQGGNPDWWRTLFGATVYLYDGTNAVEEVDSVGNVLARYTQGLAVDQPLAELRSGVATYYQQDDLGSVTSLSSSFGTLAATYTSDTFGRLTASTGTVTNPFQYTGRELDSETNIYYYRARYYDQNIGRFIGEDPTKFSGGIDFYKYGEENPANRTDPSGTQSCCSISVSCLPTHGLQFTHCTVTTFDGSSYTAYDGYPTGDVRWSRLRVELGQGSSPGPNTFFTGQIACDKMKNCVSQAVGEINSHYIPYNYVLWNSNGAAQYIVNKCGFYPHFPLSAWGARQPF
jgi:RHS repeat-associated protein